MLWLEDECRRSKILTHKELKSRALTRADVKAEYDEFEEEFAFLDQFLKARSTAGLTQTEIAERIGTTQSAIARLESGGGKYLPSLGTLQKYARALDCRLELRLVKKADTRKGLKLTRRPIPSVRKRAVG